MASHCKSRQNIGAEFTQLPFVFDAEINQNDGHDYPEQSLEEKKEKPDQSELLEPVTQLFTSEKLKPIRHNFCGRIPLES